MPRVARPSPADAVIALVLCLWELTVMGGSVQIALPAALLVSLPLAWRRQAPLAVLFLTGAGFALQAAQPHPPETLAELVAFLLAMFSLTAHAQRRALLPGVLAAAGAGVAEDVLAGGGDSVFILVLLATAGAAGYAVRRRARDVEQIVERTNEIAQQAAAAERERIARELHDVISHGVSLMVVHAGAAEAHLMRNPLTAAASLRRVQDAGRDAVDDLRRMLAVLDAPVGEPSPPQPSLEALPLLAKESSAAGSPTTVTVTGTPTRIPPGLATSVYRVVQEALTNARRHAPGAPIDVRIEHCQTSLVVRVRNDPPAGAPRGGGTGRGLPGIRERAALYGGDVEVGPTAGGGWQLSAWFSLGKLPR